MDTSPKEQTKCETCGAYIDKINQVEVIDALSIFVSFAKKDTYEYYCNTHQKPYTKIKKFGYGIPDCFFSQFQVTEDGTPIGYVKVKKKA